MKVIFLDIDGVLNNKGSLARFGPHIGIDPVLVKRFKRIIDETEAEIVLSSTWRLTEDHSAEVNRVLGQHGIKPPIDKTKTHFEALAQLEWPASFRTCFLRGAEIWAWLQGHPEVTSWVILDDNEVVGLAEESQDPRAYRAMKRRFVHTSWAAGIEQEHVAEAIRILLEE